MGLIELYAIFAIATALTALVGFYLPLVKEARNSGIENVLTDSLFLGSIIFILVTLVLAPFVVPALISPAQGDMFRIGLKKAIEKPDE